MKDQTIVQSLQRAGKERKMNNEMIGDLSMAVKQLQDLTQGLIRVMRKLPDYENILAEIQDENAAKDIEVKDPETLDFNGDNA